MFAIIGIVVVIGAILGGFLMEKGPLPVLIRPAELVIIAGAGFGIILIANPLPVVIKLFKCVLGILSGSKYTKAFYLENLKMFNEIFSYARKNGFPKLEGDFDDPHKTAIQQISEVSEGPSCRGFICDSLRMFISSGTILLNWTR